MRKIQRQRHELLRIDSYRHCSEPGRLVMNTHIPYFNGTVHTSLIHELHFSLVRVM